MLESIGSLWNRCTVQAAAHSVLHGNQRALATWYYFENATGNGGQTPIYTYQYCKGQGIAGDMVIGLLSHLEGPGFPRPPDATNSYVTGIKSRFVSLIGGTLPSPDPFGVSLVPEVSKYCK